MRPSKYVAARRHGKRAWLGLAHYEGGNVWRVEVDTEGITSGADIGEIRDDPQLPLHRVQRFDEFVEICPDVAVDG